MWADKELWIRRVATISEAEEAAQECFTAMWHRRHNAPGVTVRRYPTITRVYSGRTVSIVVSGRLVYGPESGPEYAKRFRRNTPKPAVEAKA